MATNRFQRYAIDTVAVGLNSMASGVVLIALLPMLTRWLTPSEYGLMDLAQVSVALVLPILFLNIWDGVMRFSLDQGAPHAAILKVGLLIVSIGITGVLVLGIVLSAVTDLDPRLVWSAVGLAVAMSCRSLLSEFARGMGRIWVYSITGIVVSMVLLVGAVVLVGVLRFGLTGILAALIASEVCGISWVALRLPVWKYLVKNTFDWGLTRRMVKYAGPTTAEAAAWWGINMLNRFFVVFYLGTAANGVLAAASKIPSIATTGSLVLRQSWRMSAAREYESEDRADYYSAMFTIYASIQFLMVSVLLAVLKPLMALLVGPAMGDAWRYVPFLLLGSVYSAISTFLGVNNEAGKRTLGLLLTTLCAAVTGLTLNWILIPRIGLMGSVISTLAAYVLLVALRLHFSLKIAPYRIEWKPLALANLIVIAQGAALYILSGWWLFGVEAALLIACVVARFSVVRGLFGFAGQWWTSRRGGTGSSSQDEDEGEGEEQSMPEASEAADERVRLEQIEQIETEIQ
ncbi:MAG: lipopolysaccharide biosynthesis protein [Propionibacteriaceae bacterium]|jgi:O-antigen/teichoic acid export membrane protein|nr:lipopolysaccharide biosynthesis protein [Propionibacteriaceae bacterium]